MHVIRIYSQYLATTLVALAATSAWSQNNAAQQPRDPAQVGMEILTRGPVHEAFAETVTFNPQPGIIVPNAPRQPIEEIAPDQRPEGANVAWIPGYWGWDDERNDFLWVSGIWRALPPGRQWIPGYWSHTAAGNQWTSGYWANAEVNEIQYLPEPPATVEAGPNVAASSTDDIWLPGSWVWQQNRYAWQPGNWVAGQQDWQWVPSYHVWTPRGYVAVDGYWDYSVSRRGVLFAPVYFAANAYSQNGFSYSPSIVINPGVFTSHLFLRPNYGHYYFGDYYAANYTSAGFSPWFSYQTSNSGYDPFFAYARWQNRQDRNWANQTQTNFKNFRDNENARPPRTWAAQTAVAAIAVSSPNGAVVMAAPLAEVAKSKNSMLRFQPVAKEEQQQLGLRGRDYRKFLADRQQLEATAANTSTAQVGNAAGPTTAKLPKSPFVAANVAQLGKNDVPPKRYEALKPVLPIEAQATKVDAKADISTGTSTGTGTAQTTGTTAPKGQPAAQATGQSQGATTGQQRGGSPANKQSDSNGQQLSDATGQPPAATTRELSGGVATQNQSGGNVQPQGATNGQPQGTATDKQPGASSTKMQSGTNGQQQSATAGQQQSATTAQRRGAATGQQPRGATSATQRGSSLQQQGSATGQRQGTRTSQPQRSSASRGPSGSRGQQQGAGAGQQQSTTTGQQQSGSGGQQQGTTQDSPAAESKSNDKK